MYFMNILFYRFYFFYFTSIDLNCFKIYVETILLNILLTFVCLKLLFLSIHSYFAYIRLHGKNINLYCLGKMLLKF